MTIRKVYLAIEERDEEILGVFATEEAAQRYVEDLAQYEREHNKNHGWTVGEYNGRIRLEEYEVHQ